MSNSTKKNIASARKISPMAESILNSVEPLIIALDGSADRFKDKATDPGHDLPSMQDKGLRIILDSMIRPVHRQLKGYTTQDGRKIDGQSARMTDAVQQLQKLWDRHNGDMNEIMGDPQAYRIQAWHDQCEARLNMLHEWYNAYCEVYAIVTGEQWQYQELTAAPAARPTSNADEQKARLAATFAKANERRLIKGGAGTRATPSK